MKSSKYGRREVTARVTLTRAAGCLRIAVWNEGLGFSEDQRLRLFRRCSGLQSPELRKRKGTGVGLYACWPIVQLHTGKMRATSKQGEWAEFTVEIPQPLVS